MCFPPPAGQSSGLLKTFPKSGKQTKKHGAAAANLFLTLRGRGYVILSCLIIIALRDLRDLASVAQLSEVVAKYHRKSLQHFVLKIGREKNKRLKKCQNNHLWKKEERAAGF